MLKKWLNHAIYRDFKKGHKKVTTGHNRTQGYKVANNIYMCIGENKTYKT